MKLSRTTCLLISTIGFIFFFAKPVVAQSSADDSAMYQKAVYNAMRVYHKTIGDQIDLYNGSQYGIFPFPFAEGGHPFFKTNKPGVGFVVYDDILYENVIMQYDEIQQVLCMQDSIKRLQLVNQRVSEFSLFDNDFIRIVKDSSSEALVATGFYNVLYKGNVSLLKREEKTIREEVSTGELIRFIDDHRYYYIRRNNTYYAIRAKNSVLDIFKDHKKDVRQFIRKNKLSYRKDRDNMLIKTTAYYDQLIK